jgi:PAS domain S-box-containing protein
MWYWFNPSSKAVGFSLILITLFLFWLSICVPTAKADEKLRVGIFQNKPLSFIDNNNVVKGIFPELIDEIAKREGWQIEYVVDSWSGCLKRLEAGTIDVLISIVYTPERAKIYNFSKVPVVTAWGQVYSRENAEFASILDLNYRTVGIMSKDINGRHFVELSRKFNLKINFKEAKLYDDLCLMLLAGTIDAMVVNNVNGGFLQRNYPIQQTPIMFSPVNAFFAVAQGKHQDVVARIDANIKNWKNQKDSVYYSILSNWYGNLEAYTRVPYKTIGVIIALASGLTLLLFAWNMILKKQVESRTRELRKSEERYRELSQNALVGIFQVTREGQLIFVNQRLAKILGYRSADEFLAQAVNFATLFVHNRQRRQLFHALELNGYVENKNVEFQRKDGQHIWSKLHVRAALSDEWKQIYEGLLEDITERKHAEDQLQAAHEVFLTVLDGIDSTIYVADIDTYEILFMNKKMKEIFKGDFTGQVCWKVFRNESDACVRCPSKEMLIRNGIPTEVSVREDTNPITQRHNILHDQAIKWVDGRMARIQVGTDITRLKEMEAKQRDYELRIQQMQKMEAIGTLAGGIAHDFNNILFSIVGMSQLLLEDLTPQNSEYESIHEILTAGKRGSDLVKQILAFSRQSKHEQIPVRIQSILKEILKLGRSTIPANIAINQDIDSRCGMVLADPTQLHQIVMNLVTNAFHAVEQAGGEITLQLRERVVKGDELPDHALDTGRYAVISVSDTGKGIDHAVREKIFEPYFTTKEKGKGTGLGLAVVYGLVKEHRGYIEVKSQSGRGSTFIVYLPVIERSSESALIDKVERDKTGHERLLLVDDEEAILRIECQMLERLGYQVITSISSLEAVEIIKANPDAFDLAVLDMTMPMMTGDQLARELLAVRPDLPIIMCTGFSERLTPKKIGALGIKGLLMKPVLKSEMAKMVRQVLDESKVA